jgi:hypothetical protein
MAAQQRAIAPLGPVRVRAPGGVSSSAPIEVGVWRFLLISESGPGARCDAQRTSLTGPPAQVVGENSLVPTRRSAATKRGLLLPKKGLRG